MQEITSFLDYVEKKAAPLGSFYFLTELGQSSIDEDDEDLSDRLNGTYYPKVKQKVDEFIDRCESTLAQLNKQRENLADELDNAYKNLKRNDPGSGPSSAFLNKSDPDSIDKYNRKVDEYNNKLESFRRLKDQTTRLQERFEDMDLKFKEKKADLKEQIIAKKEDLKPAFDKDLSLYVTKLSQLAFDAFQHDDRAFEGLVFTYLSKKAIEELSDRFYDANEERNAKEIAKKLDLEIEKSIKTDDRPIKDGLEGLFSYLYQTYKSNQEIAASVHQDLEQLPEKEHAFHKEDVEKALALPIITQFEYQHLIDPDELQKVASDVKYRKEEFENHIGTVENLSAALEPMYAAISGIKNTTDTKLMAMQTNKDKVFEGHFDLIQCILEVFDDDKQDAYLPRQKRWFEDFQGYLEQKEGIALPDLISDMTHTGMLVSTISSDLSSNEVLNFLATQGKLVAKKQDFVQAIPKLDTIRVAIDDQPREKAEAFTKTTTGWLNMSFIPIANLVMAFMLHNKVGDYLTALSSSNEHFMAAKETLINKLQSSFLVHIIIGALAIVAGVFVNPLIIALGAGYLMSAGFFFVKKSSLVKI